MTKWLAAIAAAGLAGTAFFCSAWLHDRSRADRLEGALAATGSRYEDSLARARGREADLERSLSRALASSTTWSEEERRPDGTIIRRRGAAHTSQPVVPCPPCPVCPDTLAPRPPSLTPAGSGEDARLPWSLDGSYGPRGWDVGGEWEFDAPVPFSRRRMYPSLGGSLGWLKDDRKLDARVTTRLQFGAAH